MTGASQDLLLYVPTHGLSLCFHTSSEQPRLPVPSRLYHFCSSFSKSTLPPFFIFYPLSPFFPLCLMLGDIFALPEILTLVVARA